MNKSLTTVFCAGLNTITLHSQVPPSPAPTPSAGMSAAPATATAQGSAPDFDINKSTSYFLGQ